MSTWSDGGPAYPQPFIYEPDKGQYGHYTQAFDIGCGGMSLRAYIATAALNTITDDDLAMTQGEASEFVGRKWGQSKDGYEAWLDFYAEYKAKIAVKYADALIAELAKDPKP